MPGGWPVRHWATPASNNSTAPAGQTLEAENRGPCRNGLNTANARAARAAEWAEWMRFAPWLAAADALSRSPCGCPILQQSCLSVGCTWDTSKRRRKFRHSTATVAAQSPAATCQRRSQIPGCPCQTPTASAGAVASADALSSSPSDTPFGQMWNPPWNRSPISQVPQIPFPSRKPR